MTEQQLIELTAAILKCNHNQSIGETPSGDILEWLRVVAETQDIQAFSEGCSLIVTSCSSSRWKYICNRIPAILGNHFFPGHLSIPEYTKFQNVFDSMWTERIKEAATSSDKLVLVIAQLIAKSKE